MANGHGGSRPGAGRKQSAITVLKGKAIEEAHDDAKYALALFVDFMQNKRLPKRFRADCAREVMDRVWGKAKQTNENRNETKIEAQVTHVIDSDTAATIFDILAGAGALASSTGDAAIDPLHPPSADS